MFKPGERVFWNAYPDKVKKDSGTVVRIVKTQKEAHIHQQKGDVIVQPDGMQIQIAVNYEILRGEGK